MDNSSAESRVPCRCLVGRSTLADVRLRSTRSSSEHATVGWYAGRWVLRDLGSSNGTFVNGKQLSARDRIVLTSGHVVRFGGDDEVWTIKDAAAPDPCAVRMGPQEYSWGHSTLLVIPSVEAPEASIFPDVDGWRLDDGSEILSLECGDIIRLPSGWWRVLIPDIGGTTHLLTAGCELDLSHVELTFSVSAERVTMCLEQGSARIQLPSRACLYTLAALARLRMDSGMSEVDAGWISCAELAEMRGCTQEKVNVDVHRLRKLLQEVGMHQAAQIIERDDAKRLRIGIRRIRKTGD